MRQFTFKILGTACVAIGIAGAFLPLLPSTIFFILAAACFARSSPKLEAKILQHPVFGPPVIAWREHGAIPFKAKLLAIGGMALGYAIFYYTAQPGVLLAVIVAIVMASCALYVGSRPGTQI